MKNKLLSIFFSIILIIIISSIVYAENEKCTISIQNYSFNSSANELTVNANIKNNNQDCILILALYNKSGTLLSHKYETILKAETEKSIKVNANSFSIDDNTIKLFLWNGVNSMKPLCDAAFPSTSDTSAPTILNIGMEDITFKNDAYLQPDIKYPLALTLNFQYNQIPDSFNILINNESYNVKSSDIKLENDIYKLILNKYIKKPNTNYDISISAVKNGTSSASSEIYKYNSPVSACGHDENGFIFSCKYLSGDNKAYSISTKEQFEHMSSHLSQVGDFYNSSLFVQLNDIDFEGKNFDKSIISNYFVDTYDGQGYYVDNFTINTKGKPIYTGVFANAPNGGTIKDFGVGSNVVITGGNLSTGGVVGSAYGDINRCYNFAKVIGTSIGESANSVYGVGGIVGTASFNVQYCYNAGEIINEGSLPTGGISGHAVNGNNYNYNIGSVKGKSYTGGIVGKGDWVNENNSHFAMNSNYNSGKVTGEDSSKTGSLIGYRKGHMLDNYYLDSSCDFGKDGIGEDSGGTKPASKLPIKINIEQLKSGSFFSTSMKKYFKLQDDFDNPILIDNIQRKIK